METKREWSLVEIEYLRTHWGKESPDALSHYLDCSLEAVIDKANELGLGKTKRSEWTDEQVEELKRLAARGLQYKEIAEKIGRTPTAVYFRTHELNIMVYQAGRKWEAWEDRFLKDQWGQISVSEIANKLRRPISAISDRAVRKGLGPISSSIEELWTAKTIGEVVGVNEDNIYSTWKRRGLKLKKIQLAKRKQYFEVAFDDLIKFLKENQDLWDSTKVEPYMLGEESEWLHEKRLRDRIQSPLKEYKRWTKQELERAMNLFKAGKTYGEIAKLLNRDKGAVGDKLRESCLNYKGAKYWKKKEIQYLEKNYQDMTYSEIGQELGRTRKSVAFQASKLGLRKK